MSQKQYAAFAANIKSWDALRQKKTNFVPGVLRVEKVILLSKSDFDKLSEDISPDYPLFREPSYASIAGKANQQAGAGNVRLSQDRSTRR